MLKHILVPLDGSKSAEKALDAAKRVLGPEGEITLLMGIQGDAPLYVYPDLDGVQELIYESDEERDTPERARAYLDHVAKNLKLSGFQADVEIGTGDPAELIIDRAIKRGVEAIVISTHGRSGLSRLLFGSVTLKVLEAAPCLVVVVPNREQVRVEDEAPAAEALPGFDTAVTE